MLKFYVPFVLPKDFRQDGCRLWGGKDLGMSLETQGTRPFGGDVSEIRELPKKLCPMFALISNLFHALPFGLNTRLKGENQFLKGRKPLEGQM